MTFFYLQFNSNSSQNGDSSDTDNDDNDDDVDAAETSRPKKSNPEPVKPPILGPDPSLPAETGRGRPKRPRTVFHKALDALQMDWEDLQLKNILKCCSRSRFTSGDEKELPASPSTSSKVNKHGQLLWQEHIPTACARVEALRTHGYTAEALRLAVAIVRTMKHNQVNIQRIQTYLLLILSSFKNNFLDSHSQH